MNNPFLHISEFPPFDLICSSDDYLNKYVDIKTQSKFAIDFYDHSNNLSISLYKYASFAHTYKFM